MSTQPIFYNNNLDFSSSYIQQKYNSKFLDQPSPPIIPKVRLFMILFCVFLIIYFTGFICFFPIEIFSYLTKILKTLLLMLIIAPYFYIENFRIAVDNIFILHFNLNYFLVSYSIFILTTIFTYQNTNVLSVFLFSLIINIIKIRFLCKTFTDVKKIINTSILILNLIIFLYLYIDVNLITQFIELVSTIFSLNTWYTYLKHKKTKFYYEHLVAAKRINKYILSKKVKALHGSHIDYNEMYKDMLNEINAGIILIDIKDIDMKGGDKVVTKTKIEYNKVLIDIFKSLEKTLNINSNLSNKNLFIKFLIF